MVPARRPNPSGHPDNPAVADPNALLRAALGGDIKEISLDIPANATRGELESTLVHVIDSLKRLRDAEDALRPFIGRILKVMDERKLYRPEFKNITDYIMRKVEGELGISRNSAFEMLRVQRKFPDLSREDFERYGHSKLLLATGVTDSTDPEHRALLDEASRMTVRAFAERVRAIKAENTSAAETFSLTARLPLDWKDSWQYLLESTGLGPSELVQELIRTYTETHAIGEGNGGQAPAQPAQGPPAKPAPAVGGPVGVPARRA